MHTPFSDLEAALLGDDRSSRIEGAAVDGGRERRTGVPEVVLAASKTPAQTVAIATELLRRSGRAIVSRVDDAALAALEQALDADIQWERYEAARLVVLRRPDTPWVGIGGVVGVLTAGTGDLPAAEEAAAMCREMGCEVELLCDVGVAGLHRLVGPLRRLMERPVDALIVAAGMDGALPSVVTGLSSVPVIGLPTSVGYGLGGKGEAALLSMLQTCVPGLAVVNIDNGIGAGAMAARIANAVAAARAAATR